jgi:leader peptidase (prepilin peptidase) / N-methyltransferase
MDELFKMLSDMPRWFWVAFWFVIGSFVGSFLNVVVYRLPRNCLSVNKPKRSFCPSCKTQLKWNDNIPIVGWAILRGKCRYCGAKFGARYPLVELLTATLFAASAVRALYGDGASPADYESWLTLLHLLAIISVLLPWALIDLDLTVIPDKLTLGPLIVFIPFAAHAPALSFGLGGEVSHLLFKFQPTWLNSMLSAVLTGLGAALALWLIGKGANVLFRRRVKEMGGEAMGLADVKLMILLGVMLGWPKLVAAFFIAILVGAVIGIVQILVKKQHGTPFGPYLALGAIASALAMPWLMKVVQAYLSMLEGPQV